MCVEIAGKCRFRISLKILQLRFSSPATTKLPVHKSIVLYKMDWVNFELGEDIQHIDQDRRWQETKQDARQHISIAGVLCGFRLAAV